MNQLEQARNLIYDYNLSCKDDELYEIEKQAQKLFPNTIVAKQGLEIIL